MKYYQMTPNTCFLCKNNDGLVDDQSVRLGDSKIIKCNHIISVGVLDLQIIEYETLLKDLKKSKRYAKIIK